MFVKELKMPGDCLYLPLNMFSAGSTIVIDGIIAADKEVKAGLREMKYISGNCFWIIHNKPNHPVMAQPMGFVILTAVFYRERSVRQAGSM